MKHTKNEPFSIKCYYCLKCNSTLGYFKSKDGKFSNIRYDSVNNRDGTYKCNVEVMARACL